MVTGLYSGALEPIWFGDRKVYSVTGFLEGVRGRITDLPAFWLQGEISDFRHQRNLTMVFFTLKDPENGYMLGCTLARSRFESLGIELSDGDMVQVFGRPDIYSPRGNFQLRAQTIEHTGRGLLMQQLEALKVKLDREGLFAPERKKPLPFIPRRVGLITGSEAAARGDFLRNINERFPTVKLVVCDTLVQGPRAAPLLVAALRRMERVSDVDVIVLARGGGAFEDFLPFSDERLCRAIAACSKPVVSAIGHEKDSPISDLVADLRVSTPTAAAREVVPDHRQLLTTLERLQGAMSRRVDERLQRRTSALQSLRGRLSSRSPRQLVVDRRVFVSQLQSRSTRRVQAMVAHRRLQLEHACRCLATIERRVGDSQQQCGRNRNALTRAVAMRVASARSRHETAMGKLRALSPQQTLARGYAIVRRADGALLRAAGDTAPSERIEVSLATGRVRATVEDVCDDARHHDG